MVGGLLAGDTRFRRVKGHSWELDPDCGAPAPGGDFPERTSFTVLDIETTGGSPTRDGVTELGAVKVRAGAAGETFSTLVEPETHIPPGIERLTGITNEMVAGMPRLDSALPRLVEFWGDDVLVAHHAPFDMGFLGRAWREIAGRIIANPVLCTVKLSRRLLPGLESHSLDRVTRRLGVNVENRHRALGDALATAEVLIDLLRRLPRHGVLRTSELLRFQNRPGKPRKQARR